MRIFFVFFSLLVLAGCGVSLPSEAPQINSGTVVESGTSSSVDQVLSLTVDAIKSRDMITLSKLISSQGLRFSPYSYVDPKTDLQFDAKKLLEAWSTGSFVWGVADGSGEPLKMSFPEYYDIFVYDVDFAQLSEEYINTPLQRGNVINNVFDVYKDAYIVEYYVPGLNPEYEGMDWRSLMLVFVEENGQWKLRAIVHNQWTI